MTPEQPDKPPTLEYGLPEPRPAGFRVWGGLIGVLVAGFSVLLWVLGIAGVAGGYWFYGGLSLATAAAGTYEARCIIRTAFGRSSRP